MEKRMHLYISRKHAALWLTLLLLAASVLIRIAVLSQLEGVGVWRQIVWPAAFTVLFALSAVISGQEMLHRIAVPVWLHRNRYSVK